MESVKRNIQRLSFEGKFRSVGLYRNYFSLSSSWQNLVSYWHDRHLEKNSRLVDRCADYDINVTPSTFSVLYIPYYERPRASNSQMKERERNHAIAERIKKEFYERK